MQQIIGSVCKEAVVNSLLVLLMTVLSQTFLTFVSGYLMSFSFFTTRHNTIILYCYFNEFIC